MKDILNTYSVKELKQFISKYNKSLGSVKRYSILKKGELVELMTKKENASKFKSIKAKAKPPAPKKIDSVSKKNRNAPKPKPKEKETAPKPVNTKMPKFNIISKQELEKRKEKREEQKTKPKQPTIKSVEKMISKGKIIINDRKILYFVNLRPSYKVQMFEDYIQGQVGEQNFDDWKRKNSNRAILARNYGFFEKHKTFMDKLLVVSHQPFVTGVYDEWRIATPNSFVKHMRSTKDPIELVVKKLLDTKGERDDNELKRLFEDSNIWDDMFPDTIDQPRSEYMWGLAAARSRR